MTNNELYQILLRLPLANDDIGKIYQYLISIDGGDHEIIEKILKLIPLEASETNQLADKKFVESIVSPDSGVYISKDDSGVPFDSYDELVKFGKDAKNNDYALVSGRDSSNNEILIPYKATVIDNVIKWGKKYKNFVFINNVLSEANFAAMRSGINVELVIRFIAFIDWIEEIVPKNTDKTNKLANEKYVKDYTEEATDAEVIDILNK